MLSYHLQQEMKIELYKTIKYCYLVSSYCKLKFEYVKQGTNHNNIYRIWRKPEPLLYYIIKTNGYVHTFNY